MKKFRSFIAAALALAALGTAGMAQARDNVYWSIGVNSYPGVSVGVGNHRAPVYMQPAPVYVQPQPYYVPPPQVVYVPNVRPVYAPVPVYGASYYRSYGHGHGHHRHHGHRHGGGRHHR